MDRPTKLLAFGGMIALGRSDELLLEGVPARSTI